MRVEVYYNLHKNVFSVRHKGRVIQHTKMAVIKDAEYVVRPSGRAKILREGKKNVHAFVRGEWLGMDLSWKPWVGIGQSVTYNPYKYSTFVDALTEEAASNTDYVVLWKVEDQKPQIRSYYYG